MRLMIVRHGDPDYLRDTLTETGWREAELVAERMEKEQIDAIYVSPMGRAQDTASCTLKRLGREAVTLEWLKEFSPKIHRPDILLRKTRVWDWLPEDRLAEEIFHDFDHWYDADVMQEGQVKEEYLHVCHSLDALLASHGYVHDGEIFRAEDPNHDTIVLFCHFGVQMVILSHLLHISPMDLWHGFTASPASVTTLYTEERRKGKAVFRVMQLGDTSHLYAAGSTPSFSARYCECFEDDTRH